MSRPTREKHQFAIEGPPTRFGIGRLAPIVLLSWLIIDTSLRFLPAEWLNLRPVLAAARFPRPHGPFQPNVSFYTKDFTGEAALEGNLPTTEHRPPIRFSTDSLGFRLNPVAGNGSTARLLTWRGASFAYGAALSDAETFPAQLADITGQPVFNGGRFHLDPDGWPEFDWLLSNLESKPETVVLLHLEHAELPPISGAHAASARVGKLAEWRQSIAFRYARRVALTWQHLSPLEIVSTRMFKAVSNNVILPNPYERYVEPKLLPKGAPMLIRQYEVASAMSVRNESYIRRQADQFAAIRERLLRRGMNLIVVLLPTRHTVFSPWFEDSKGLEAPAHDYLHALEGELIVRRIVTVNGLTVFRRTTEAEVAAGDLSFYRDDNHWTPRGVRSIAAAVAASLDKLSNSEL